MMVVFLSIVGANAHAAAIYEWVCDTAGCNGDTDFSSVMTISDSAFAAGDFTGVTDNILDWTTTSGVGVGYTLTLPTMFNGVGPTADQANIRIVLSQDKSEIAALWDVSAGTNITFSDPLIGRVDFYEGENYSVGSLQDAAMFANQEFSNIFIAGRFIQSAPVPEPSTMILFGAGLVGLAATRLRRKQKK